MIKYNFNASKESLEAAKKHNETIDVMINFRTNSFPLVHTHDYWEIVVMKENSAINVIDGEEHILKTHDFCLLYPENQHLVNPLNHLPPHYYNLMIRTEFLLSIINLISPKILQDPKNNIPQYGTCKPQIHTEIIQLLNKSFNLKPDDIVENQRILRLIVIKLVSILLTPQLNSYTSGDLISQLVSIMSNPENMRLSLKQIAKKMGYSQEYIIRTLQKKGLESPHKIFISVKFEYARLLLCNTDFRTPYIAEQIGFSDVGYFSKLFKDCFGCSPTEYRKNNPLQ